MKREFIRCNRENVEPLLPLRIDVEKRKGKSGNGIIQALLNIAVYLLIFFLFMKDNMQYMKFFIAFMIASVLVQIIIGFSRSVGFKSKFPYIYMKTDRKQYLAKLAEYENKIDNYIDCVKSNLSANLCSTQKIEDIIRNLDEKLFYRLPSHFDFLTFNLGVGYYRFPIVLNYPNKAYYENDRELEKFQVEIENKIRNKDCEMLNFPISLLNQKFISFVNSGLDEEDFYSVLNSTIIDLASFQSSEELLLCFAMPLENNMDWVRFLPHVWHGSRRMIFNGIESQQDFYRQIDDAITANNKHIVIVMDSDYMKNYTIYSFLNREFIAEKVSILSFSFMGKSPSRTNCIVKCYYKNNQVFGQVDDCEVKLNMLSDEKSDELARLLYNVIIIDNHNITKKSIPERVLFLEMFNAKVPSELPCASVNESIQIQDHFPVIVGLGNESNEISIDITNKGDGNHCLITGTNGSGKSEFLLSYVLAACAKYSPDYLSFVAIDFKNGAMSNFINDLPHCCGEFINDGDHVSTRELTRIAEMLESEIEYRLDLLKKSGCEMNLAKYHKLYSEKKVSVPLPRVLIIVDEVAVFFKTDRNAVNYIEHIATVGRQAGMILLLATQSKGGVIPSQVKTNININIDFFSEDDIKSNKTKIKGRAIINSFLKNDEECQMGLSAVHNTNSSIIDFITCSGKSRVISDTNRETQFMRVKREISQNRYNYDYGIHRVLQDTLEEFIEGDLYVDDVIETFFSKTNVPVNSFPIGISDDIYNRKREAFVYSPSLYNLLVYGCPQSGKTMFVKNLIYTVCHREYGLNPNAINIYIVAKNSVEYQEYLFPQIGSVLSVRDIYYFLLFIDKKIEERSSNPSENHTPIIAIIDDCYLEIQQNNELLCMLERITKESIGCNISIICTLTAKPTFFSSFERYFTSRVVLYMGEDFDYGTLIHLDKIKKIPYIKGRCFTNIVGKSNQTLETQIAYLDESEYYIQRQSKDYLDLWIDRKKALMIPLMPKEIQCQIDVDSTQIPVGIERNLSNVYWNYKQSNTYLISYFSDEDAVNFVRYLISVFTIHKHEIILVDNQSESVKASNFVENVSYFRYNQAKEIEDNLLSIESSNPVVLIMFDYARTLFPSSGEEVNLTKQVNQLITSKKIIGVFAEHKEFINYSRSQSATRISQFLEGESSGLLLGNAPINHTFGANGLPVALQDKTLNPEWGVNISRSREQTRVIKIAAKAIKMKEGIK